ncbi:peroxisomal biogenesis factor 3 [[Candida] jaroonii]|uniref:Peroxisomal biogenesis factor 3 n=1 Tax=[Candida] jaroonii TaxID=467808 RepID=A0ACA9Y816_9ASCO|nr:peroxisomal biogenesis factor 3 [[Candida] jaroonii]
MAIFSSLSSFFNKHKRKIFITSTVGVSVYYLVNYFIIRKFRNFQNSLTQDLFIKEQIKRRFIQTQNDCYYTLLSLLPVLIDPIISNSPIELITKALKLKKSNQNNKEISDSMLTTDNLILHSTNDNELNLYLNKSKSELWKLLKVKTLTRFLTLNYCISSLLLLTRLQLNILARKSYLQSAIQMTNNSTSQHELTEEEYFIEQSYLSLSWWLLNKGWESINLKIEAIVDEKFKLLNARNELTIDEFKYLLSDCINEINDDKLLLINAIFPNNDNLNLTLLNIQPNLINNFNQSFVKLINETTLILNNDYFLENLNVLVLTNIDTLVTNLFNNLNDSNTKLANLLAQLSVQCELLSNNNFENFEELSGNQYINELNNLDSLDDFSASIYSNIE